MYYHCFIIFKECQSNTCQVNNMYCQVGYMPILTVSEGKCCPEHICGELINSHFEYIENLMTAETRLYNFHCLTLF